MATANVSSVRKAQTPSVCHLCEANPTIRWKCLECDLLMCTNCKEKVHSKFKSASDHQVVNTKEIGTDETQLDIDIKPEKCNKHSKQNFSLFCSTCGEPVCVECITNTHNRHEFEHLENVYRYSVSELQYYRDVLQNELLPFVTHEKMGLQKEYSIEADGYSQCKANIMERQNKLKETIDELAKKNVAELENHWKERKKFYAEKEKRIKFLETTMKDNHEECDSALSSRRIRNVQNSVAKIKRSLKEVTITTVSTKPEVQSFDSDSNMSITSEVFGKLNRSSDAEIRFRLVKVYTSKFKSFIQLSRCLPPSNSAWVLDNDTVNFAKIIAKVQLKSDLEIEEQYSNIDADVIATLPSSEVLCSFYNETCVQRLSKDGKLEMFINTHPLMPRALHVSKSKKIIVGMRECGPAFPVTKDSIRQIVIFSEGRKVQKEIRFDRDGQSMLSYPYQITSNINGDICVIDGLSVNCQGRLVDIGAAGNTRWTYNGNRDKNEFFPSGITTTSSGNIILSDYSFDELHVLSMDGQILLIQDTTTLGFIAPHSLDTGADNSLWIGCAFDREEQPNAKLAVLKCEGF